MEFINTSISATELCHKHNISPTTFQDWKDKFLQGGKEAPPKQRRQDQKSRKGGRESQACNRREHHSQQRFKKILEGTKR